MIESGFLSYTKWSAILTVVGLVLTILAFILQWGIRFRLVGITSFLGVLTIGLFGLSLGLFAKTTIPGAVRYGLVYDNGANQAVVNIAPQVTENQVEATLKQAVNDLFSTGRGGVADDLLTVRVRTLLHSQDGITEPLYLGQVRRSLVSREDNNLEIEIYSKNFRKLPKSVT